MANYYAAAFSKKSCIIKDKSLEFKNFGRIFR